MQEEPRDPDPDHPPRLNPDEPFEGDPPEWVRRREEERRERIEQPEERTWEEPIDDRNGRGDRNND